MSAEKVKRGKGRPPVDNPLCKSLAGKVSVEDKNWIDARVKALGMTANEYVNWLVKQDKAKVAKQNKSPV
ncbi:MAG: hypothetical protein RL755_34 [Pseudomonadota bacterium]|jgi:hypothetical protein